MPGVLFSAIAAVVVGTVLVLAGGFEYRSTALLQLADPSSSADMAALRGRLTEFATQRVDSAVVRLNVEAPADDLLRLNLITNDRDAGVGLARSLAQAFLASVEAGDGQPRARERWLQTRLEDLQQRLDTAEQRVIASIARTSLDNPEAERNDLLGRWKAYRSEFEAARADLRRTALALQQLQRTPAPTRASVRAEVRQDAIASDESLQQDIAQLAAELADLRAATLEEWQQTAPLVDELVSGVSRLLEAAATALRSTEDANLQVDLEQIEIDGESYRERVSAFSRTWTQQFLSLKTIEPQALSNALFDVLGRVDSIQGEFLFHAGKTLSNLQTRARNLGDGADGPRLHVIESDVVRAFESLRLVHDRFSLAASGRPSVAIDAALRTSRRLDRRAREAIARIDEKLEAEALEQAKRAYVRAADEAQKAMEASRARYDGLAARLIELQDELNVNSDLTADFLRESLASEFASLHLQDVVREVDKTAREMSALRGEREAEASGRRMRLRQVVPGGAPANLAGQLRLGGIGAVLTFVVSLLSQWHLLRRRRATS